MVLFVDECHLNWGNICGYVWGKRSERVEIDIGNEKERQTYYGALNYQTGQVIMREQKKGDTENTIEFIKHLRRCYKGARIVVIWDGVKYHWSEGFREYLREVNGGKPEAEWEVTCIRLAPNAPEQNPIEDVWLQGKNFLRQCWHLCKNFGMMKWLFSWFVNNEVFQFLKLSMYGSFS